MASLNPTYVRNIVTPVSAVLFIVSTITGMMLFFHWQGGLVKASHEWLSIAFSAIVIWHLVRNWTSFSNYFRNNIALSAIIISLVASLAFTGMTGRTGGGSPRIVFKAVSQASVEHAAPAFGLTTAEAMARLKAAGYSGAPSDSLNAVGKRAGKRGSDVMMLLAAKMPR